jgi:hypothetical protein
MPVVDSMAFVFSCRAVAVFFCPFFLLLTSVFYKFSIVFDEGDKNK